MLAYSIRANLYLVLIPKTQQNYEKKLSLHQVCPVREQLKNLLVYETTSMLSAFISIRVFS